MNLEPDRRGNPATHRRGGKPSGGAIFPRHLQFCRPAAATWRSSSAPTTPCSNACRTAWAGRDAGLAPADSLSALILASIVEKETGTPSDPRMIAGVFVNRLRKGMLLQTRPDRDLRPGREIDGNLRRRDLLADTAYE